MKLILASNSPRRKELLTEYGFDFEVIKSDFVEKTEKTLPQEVVLDFAYGKAKDVFNKIKREDIIVLGADTVVEIDGKILGKPNTKEEAIKMLNSLSNRAHNVFTGYAIIGKEIEIKEFVKTEVVFNKLSNKLIKSYVESGSPMDKAGAYGIQDGYNLSKEVNGSYNNVIGLPIEIISSKLKELLK